MEETDSQSIDPGKRKRKLETKTTVTRCSTCNREFPSRNQLFKRLRASNNGCCDPDFVSPTIEVAADGSFLTSHRKRGEIQHKRVVLIVAYLGKNFHGSARNDCIDSVPTVEGCLWKAVCEVFPDDNKKSTTAAKASFRDYIASKTNPKAMTRSSRTDKGVSALGNVFSLMLPWVWSSEIDFTDRVNSALPHDVRLLRAMCQSEQSNLPQSFDARSHCEARRYRYFVPAKALFRKGVDTEKESIMDLRKQLKKLLKQWGGTHSFHNFTNWKTDEDLEKRAALDLESKHDDEEASCTNKEKSKNKITSEKATYTDKPEDEPTFFRHILRCHVEDVIQYKEQKFVIISIKGQSFLYHQIRKMMGVSIAIMNGSLPADFITKAFQEGETSMSGAAPLAPSEGLIMVEAMYSKYCSKHQVEPIGLGSKFLYREKKKFDAVSELEEANRKASWDSAAATLLRDTQDFQQKVYDQVCQDQLGMFQDMVSS